MCKSKLWFKASSSSFLVIYTQRHKLRDHLWVCRARAIKPTNIIYISYDIKQTAATILTCAVIMKLHTSCLVLLFTTWRTPVTTCHNLNGSMQTKPIKTPLNKENSFDMSKQTNHIIIMDGLLDFMDHNGNTFWTEPA